MLLAGLDALILCRQSKPGHLHAGRADQYARSHDHARTHRNTDRDSDSDRYAHPDGIVKLFLFKLLLSVPYCRLLTRSSLSLLPGAAILLP